MPDEFQKDFETLCKAAHEKVMQQREEIIEAFIAKHGCGPDECMQVIEHTPTGMKFYICKREDFRVRNETPPEDPYFYTQFLATNGGPLR